MRRVPYAMKMFLPCCRCHRAARTLSIREKMSQRVRKRRAHKSPGVRIHVGVEKVEVACPDIDSATLQAIE